jgi:uncharacterized protein
MCDIISSRKFPAKTRVNRNHPVFKKNAEPFFAIIMEGLKGEVSGEHFWDAVAENAVLFTD